jgi:hypothetical protein
MRPYASFQAPTPEELAALRRVPKHPRDQALIEVLVNCGLRVTEICALQLKHVHWDSEAPYLRLAGKGSPVRQVPLNLQAQEALRTWLEQRPRSPHPFVFPHLRTGGRLTRKAVWAILRRHSRQAGLRPLSPQLLRQGFGLALAQHQVPADQIGALMGRARRAHTAGAQALREAVAHLDLRSRLARWWSRLRNHSFRFFAPSSQPAPSVPLVQTVGRQAELQQLQTYADRRVDTLVLGPAGVGKSHLLGLLQGKHLLRLQSLTPVRQGLIELAQALHQRGAFPVASGDFDTFRKRHTRTSIQGWLRLVLDAAKKDQWVLVIDDLSTLSPYLGRLLDQLGSKFRFIAALREVKKGYAAHFARFERLSLANLSRRETQQLLRQHFSGLEVEDLALLETRLWEHSGGNPRALLEMVERLGREPGVTAEAVRQLRHPGSHPQIDLTPIILVPAVLLVAARFIARGLGDTEAYILAGIGAALVMGAQFFLFRMRR